MSFSLLCLCGLLFGIGMGVCVQKSGFCITAGFAAMLKGRGKHILKQITLIFIICCSGFYLSSYLSPSLGLKPVGLLRGGGFLNLIAGLLFGAGIFISGGCILGSLRRLGEGDLSFLIVIAGIAIGVSVVAYGLNPFWGHNILKSKLLLTEALGVKASILVSTLVLIAVLFFIYLGKKGKARS